MMAPSLCQYVAQAGGVKLADAALQGELDSLRYLNQGLRGRNSVLRSTGRPLDIMALDAIDEGYPVTEGGFLESLESDARALTTKTTRGRVWLDYELEYAEICTFDADYESFLMERAECPVCASCGVHSYHATEHDGETLCEDCIQWAQSLTGELAGFYSVPVARVQWIARAALTDALKRFTA